MTQAQIQTLIEDLRAKTAANSISPDMLAAILTQLNHAPAVDTRIIESLPMLYCEVVKGKLYLRNYEYYANLGLKPVLFRYIRWRNRYRLRKKDMHSPKKKGWHANGLLGTLRVTKDGLVMRTEKVISDYPHAEHVYRDTASTFVNNGLKTDRVTWGSMKIPVAPKDRMRMIRLQFAIGYAKDNKLPAKGIHVDDLQSNLAPFFIRGQKNWRNNMTWSFSR